MTAVLHQCFRMIFLVQLSLYNCDESLSDDFKTMEHEDFGFMKDTMPPMMSSPGAFGIQIPADEAELLTDSKDEHYSKRAGKSDPQGTG